MGIGNIEFTKWNSMFLCNIKRNIPVDQCEMLKEHIFSIYNFTLYILLNFCLEENPAVLSHQTGNQSSLRTVRLHLCREEHGLSDGGDQLQGVCLHRSVTKAIWFAV